MTVAKVAEQLNLENGGEGLPPLLLMTDQSRLPDPRPALDQLPAGSAVILRHYDSPQRLELGRDLRQMTKARRQLLLVAGDAMLAAYLGADGLHLPDRANGQNWRLKMRPGWLLTAAAHSERSLLRAASLGADAALLSPVFPTKSHPDQAGLGSGFFAKLVRSAALPVYALGGITDENAQRLLASGSVGIAGISGLTTISD